MDRAPPGAVTPSGGVVGRLPICEPELGVAGGMGALRMRWSFRMVFSWRSSSTSRRSRLIWASLGSTCSQ